MMDWKYNKVDCDILIYGALCTPCLFGENAYKMNKHPSCVSHALSYWAIAVASHVFGGYIGHLLLYQNPCIISACGTLCSSMAIGEYAGQTRSQTRGKFSIYGSVQNDKLLHCLVSPCAVCQEAQEIRWHAQHSITGAKNSIPEHQIMVRK